MSEVLRVAFTDHHPNKEKKFWIGCVECAKTAPFETRLIPIEDACRALYEDPNSGANCDNCCVDLRTGKGRVL